ncbi:hypothetical protein R5H30_04105 [Sulfitobacter sp. D35]|uniref:hypothetical protein n=1 Tax=Sulfitobacter sp. D35 TaxID=3083252 RepID=UPI00296E8B2D|nr:hypothetical protein [Sulfitobacter sp. D35]MDW4497154.1 hypothetical protein [Sulfitobacter sp. D35]
MTIQKSLDDLRRNLPGCHLTAFGDLSSGLILRSSSEARRAREELDQICVDAMQAFALGDARSGDAGGKGDACRTALSFTAEKTLVCGRHDPEQGDMYCALIEAGQDIAHAITCIERVATEMAKDVR